MANPIRLSDVLGDISRLYSTFRQSLDRKDLEALTRRLIFLRKTINENVLAVLNVVNAATDDKLSSAKLNQWEVQPPAWKLDVLKKLEEKISLEDTVELSEFLGNVSSAVVTAQKNLNNTSTQYVSELEQSRSRIPPTYFAIPSIKAEMKLGFTELTTRGVNIILFKNETQKKEYVESTVTFELVAAPPLPASVSPPPGELAPGPVSPEVIDIEPIEPEPPLLRTTPREQPSELELRESMELARATFYAAVDRLVDAKEEVMKEPQKKAVKPARKTGVKKTTKKPSAKKRTKRKG
jgi:hypothetical protein